MTLNNFVQHLVTKYGDHFLKVIKKLSQGLNLSLDGEASLQNNEVRKLSSVTNPSRKLSPAKFEAWKMWHEDGLSIQMIAVCLIILFLLLKIYAAHVFNFLLLAPSPSSSSTTKKKKKIKNQNLCNLRTFQVDQLL